MKLWRKKGAALDPEVERYTVGDDYLLDRELLPYDLEASAAHVKMLRARKLISPKEKTDLLRGLREIGAAHAAGRFCISPADEDCHTAIEKRLVARFGDTGRKVHTARSRNDQVMTALRLLMKDRLSTILREAGALKGALERLARGHRGVPMPGYTHMRKAMPTTVGALLGAYAGMLADGMELISGVRRILDKSPLGSAAGFGSPIPIDRRMTARLMGFACVQENPIHCANSRGRYESLAVYSLFFTMQALNRMASDLLLFSMPEFGFFTLPVDVCTGSSMMPQKQNPDVLELVRANAHAVRADLARIDGIILDLPSGYNRDYQLTKKPLLASLRTASDSLRVMTKVFSRLGVDAAALRAAMTPELYATHRACRLVKEGVPFRKAYRMEGLSCYAPGPNAQAMENLVSLSPEKSSAE